MNEAFRIVTAMAATGALLASVGPAQAAFPGANGRIGYAVEDYPTLSDAAGFYRIQTVLPDGTGARTLAVPGTGPIAFSPDGRRVLFVDGYDGDLRIAPVSRRGPVRRLKIFDAGPVYEYAGSPDWSPSGRRIVFQRTPTDGPTELWIHYFNGERRLTDGADPAWSSRGDIAFTATGLGGDPGGIRVIRPDGGGVRQVANRGQGPDWSPDGRRIVFTVGAHIALVRANGTGLRRLSVVGGGPSFSPDGKQIVFWGKGGLSVTTPAGRHVQRVRSHVTYKQGDWGTSVYPPDWQPRP